MKRISILSRGLLVMSGLLLSANVANAKAVKAEVKPAAAAATQPTVMGNVTGTVTFTQDGKDLKVVADLKGLTPGMHGFHIHEKGDLSAPDLSSAGDHYNPGGKHHGGMDAVEHHAGDLGNINADKDGNAHKEGVMKDMNADDLKGHSVIVHAKPDDEKTDPSGNSGARIAGGKIE